ncbi:MAG: helix-turn-helix transcriptional regulator [Rhizobiaceae bacterium]|nr:helix-turn-helix transcriptional regulator [Rhizobiaceae bacterium]
MAAHQIIGPGSGNRLGTRWRGKLPIPHHTHPLVRRLFQEMNRQKTTLTEVAERAGIRRGTISDWRYRYTPRVSDLDAAFNVLGLELSVRPKRED